MKIFLWNLRDFCPSTENLLHQNFDKSWRFSASPIVLPFSVVDKLTGSVVVSTKISVFGTDTSENPRFSVPISVLF